MLHLRLSITDEAARPVGDRLLRTDGVHRVLDARSPDERITVISADVDPGVADELLETLRELGLGDNDYVLTRHDVVAPISARRLKEGAGFAWLEVLGEARSHSRPLARFVAMMAIAGVVAALGVLESNSVLIVGAMAVSPDLLPVSATCVAIVAGRRTLLMRSLATLTIGLGIAAAMACLLTFLVIQTGLVSQSFSVASSSIEPLAAHTDYSTILVALAAGIAAMLSFETRASAAVGVAISVTTIPASAYLGVALGNGEASDGLGALLVLTVNVVLLIVSGTATLWIQRLIAARADRKQPAA